MFSSITLTIFFKFLSACVYSCIHAAYTHYKGQRRLRGTTNIAAVVWTGTRSTVEVDHLLRGPPRRSNFLNTGRPRTEFLRLLALHYPQPSARRITESATSLPIKLFRQIAYPNVWEFRKHPGQPQHNIEKQEAQLPQRERASNIVLSYGAKGVSIRCTV